MQCTKQENLKKKHTERERDRDRNTTTITNNNQTTTIKTAAYNKLQNFYLKISVGNECFHQTIEMNETTNGWCEKDEET